MEQPKQSRQNTLPSVITTQHNCALLPANNKNDECEKSSLQQIHINRDTEKLIGPLNVCIIQLSMGS